MIPLLKVSLCLALSLAALAASAQNRKPPLSGPDAFDYVVGTQTIGAAYQFTQEPRLVETARAILGMGSNTIKFALDADKADLPHPQTLADVVRRDPAIQTVLGMPFAHYLLWAYAKNAPGGQFRAQNYPAQYKEIYDLTRTLLQTYNGTGKTFYLGNWEGDWHLLHDYNAAYVPTPEEIQDMIGWVNTRQKAVDDAKRDTPHANVGVFYYLEVNRVLDAEQGKVRMTSAVLPKTNPDFVSYSSYDSLGGGDIEARLKHSLDFVQAQLASKPGIPGKRVFIGEYGFPAIGHSPQEQDSLTRQVMRAGLSWGCPFVLYWEMFNNEVTKDGKQRGFWLIDDKNVKQPVYATHQRFYAQARRYVADFQKTRHRLPTRAEFGAAAIPWLADPPYSAL